MTVSITTKVIYTIHDSEHPSESYDCEGVEGLDKHFEECLGGIIDMIDSESWTSTVSRSKLKMYDSMYKHLDKIKTIINLKECIDDIKNEFNEYD